MVRALPDDGNRYEVIDGELFVTPAPSVGHQRAVLELALLVAPYLRAHRIGEALISPADVIVYGPRKFVQPDLFVVPLVRGAPMQGVDRGRSPSSHRRGALALHRAHRSRVASESCTRERRSPSTGSSIPMSEPSRRRRPDDSPVEILTESLECSRIRTLPPLVVDLHGYFDPRTRPGLAPRIGTSTGMEVGPSRSPPRASSRSP
jgi:hypothetical protein